MNLKRRSTVFAVTALMSVAGAASASPITITNYSFETTGTFLGGCGTGCNIYTQPPGWTGVAFGGFQPGTDQGNFTYFNTLSDGITSLYMNDLNSVASQTVAPTVQLGVLYTLMVDLGARNDTPFAAIASLVINGNTYTATGTAPVAGGWSMFSVQYIGQAADVGSAITIQLTTSGIQGNFDNVRLDALSPQPVPEPATLLMLGAGLVIIANRFRRRRSNR